jgi:hypothetical protein
VPWEILKVFSTEKDVFYMISIKRPPRTILSFLAVLALALLPAACSPSPEEEVAAYVTEVEPLQVALARSLIVQGQLIDKYYENKDFIDTESFILTEERLEEEVKKIGTVEGLDAMELPDNPAIQGVHRNLTLSVAYLLQCRQIIMETAYSKDSMVIAAAMWDSARENFLLFTEDLEALKGTPIAEAEARRANRPKMGTEVPSEEAAPAPAPAPAPAAN